MSHYCINWEMMLPRDLCCHLSHSLIFYRFAVISSKFNLFLFFLQHGESVSLAAGLLEQQLLEMLRSDPYGYKNKTLVTLLYERCARGLKPVFNNWRYF